MRKRRAGFTLVDVLISLSLLGVFVVLAYRVIGANFQFTAATRDASDNAARFDYALRTLRADVSDSSSVEMPAANLLRVHGPDKQLVEWKTDREVLSRKMGTEERAWDIGHPVNLKLDGAVVLLTPDSAEPIAMASMHAPTVRGAP